jgi:RND family efflux transporter MFP subunit
MTSSLSTYVEYGRRSFRRSLKRSDFFSLLCLCALATGPSKSAELEKLEVRAQLVAHQSVVFSSEIAGKILSLPFREGETFALGQEIAAIDCATYRARLAQSNAQVNRAKRKIEAIRLLEKRGATGKIDLDLADIDVDAAEAEKELAEIDVARCSINAPFSGRVAELKAKRYQYVTVGQPILDVLNHRDLELEAIAPSRWLSWLKAGTIFEVRIDELDRTFRAVVTRLGGRIDPVSQSMTIFAQIDGNFPELVPGMSGLARFSPNAEASVRR